MQIMVRYKVKADCAEENVRLIKAVFAQLETDSPQSVRYATFKLPDGVSFMHIAKIDTTDGSNPLVTLDAFKQFSGAIKDRCEEPPVTTALETVGSYRAF